MSCELWIALFPCKWDVEPYTMRFGAMDRRRSEGREVYSI